MCGVVIPEPWVAASLPEQMSTCRAFGRSHPSAFLGSQLEWELSTTTRPPGEANPEFPCVPASIQQTADERVRALRAGRRKPAKPVRRGQILLVDGDAGELPQPVRADGEDGGKRPPSKGHVPLGMPRGRPCCAGALRRVITCSRLPSAGSIGAALRGTGADQPAAA